MSIVGLDGKPIKTKHVPKHKKKKQNIKTPTDRDAQKLCDKYNCDAVMIFFSREDGTGIRAGGADNYCKAKARESGKLFLGLLRARNLGYGPPETRPGPSIVDKDKKTGD